MDEEKRLPHYDTWFVVCNFHGEVVGVFKYTEDAMKYVESEVTNHLYHQYDELEDYPDKGEVVTSFTIKAIYLPDLEGMLK